MLKTLSTGALCLLLSLISIKSNAQDLEGVQIKKRLTVEFGSAHTCMSQTRASTKEEALYNMDKCGSVKYRWSNRGRYLKILQKNEEDKWYQLGKHSIAHSFEDQVNSGLRMNFLTKDGSIISYIPESNVGPLVILDLVGQELIYFISE